MSTAAATPIRLQLGLVSNPPVFPFDALTGLAPQIFRGVDANFQIGIFGPGGAAVDLSNLAYLEADIFPLAIFNQKPGTNFSYNPYSILPFPNLPPAPLLFQTVVAADITPTITVEAWENGTDQQASVTFPWGATQSLELAGCQMQQFWLVVHGVTAAGARLIYGATRLDVYETGAQGIYLPNASAPLTVPANTIFYCPPNIQIPFSETIDIAGTVDVDGELVQY